jgi:hypothetical protein
MGGYACGAELYRGKGLMNSMAVIIKGDFILDMDKVVARVLDLDGQAYNIQYYFSSAKSADLPALDVFKDADDCEIDDKDALIILLTLSI